MTMTALSRMIGTGSDDIARVMRAVLQDSDGTLSADAWQVAGRANVPFAELVDILQKLREQGLLEFHGSQLRLTPDGEAFARTLQVTRIENVGRPVCAGSGF